MATNLYSAGTTDTLLAAKLDLAGGTMTGALNLAASGIIFSDATYLTTAPAGSTPAADQLTAGVVTANPSAGPTASGDVLQYNGSALVWTPGGGGTPFNGGAITNPITIAGSTIDSEMSSDFFGIELSADTSKGSVLYYTGLDTYDGSSHMLVGPTGLTFPDATTQGTAGIGEAPVDGSAYNRKNGAWEIAGSGGSVAWGAITGTLSDQTDLQTALNAKWTPESGDLSLGGYSITNGNVDCSAGYVTAMNFTVTSGGSITFPDSTTQTTAGIGDAPSDGTPYARQNAGWVSVAGGSLASDQITAGVVTANPTTGPSSDWSSLYYASGSLYWSTAVAPVQISNGYATSVAANPVPGQFLKFNSVSQLEWADLPTPPPTVKTVNNIDVSSSDYVLALTDANNIVNVSAGDGSYSGKAIIIPAESSVNFAVGTEILFTVTSGGSNNYINGDSGVTVIQASNSLNYNLMRTAVKLGSDLWMISSQI